MQLVVSQLVFASSTGETTEILNDRRKVMVTLFPFLPHALANSLPLVFAAVQNMSRSSPAPRSCCPFTGHA